VRRWFSKLQKRLIMDRDASFRESFRTLLEDEDVVSFRLPPHSPNMNAFMERFFRSHRNPSALSGRSSLASARCEMPCVNA